MKTLWRLLTLCAFVLIPATAHGRPETVSKPIALARLSRASGHDLSGAKIMGGVTATPGDDPWQVGLVLASDDADPRTLFCGGSIIGLRIVLTAAHCVDNGTSAQALDVVAGTTRITSGGRRIHVNSIIVDPDYGHPTAHSHDVALLVLAGDIPPNAAKIDVVAGPDDGLLVQGLPVRVTGWGAVAPDGGTTRDLRTLPIAIISNNSCNDTVAYGGRVEGSMMCAGFPGGHDACQGDSGGPLSGELHGKRVLIGVVSWGESCGLDPKWGVYARLSAIPWIARCADGNRCTSGGGTP